TSQPLTLADGVSVRPFVGSENITVDVDDLPRLRTETLPQEASGIPIGDETDVVRIRLGGDAQPSGSGLSADFVLGGNVPEGEDRALEPVISHDGEHVALVFRRIRRTVQFQTLLIAHDGRVVAGDDGVEPQGDAAVQERGELD